MMAAEASSSSQSWPVFECFGREDGMQIKLDGGKQGTGNITGGGTGRGDTKTVNSKNSKKMIVSVQQVSTTTSNSPHEFFDKIKNKKHIVNQRARRNSRFNKFSYFFELLFKDMDPVLQANMQTWMEVFGKNYSLNPKYIHPFMMDQARKLFEELNIDPEGKENRGVFYFWIYLNKELTMYMSLIRNGYNRRDRIFGFTTGFGIHQTKVVIVGQDPTKTVNSSGFAFHLSPCRSTEKLVQSVSNEMSLMYALTQGKVPKVLLQQYNEACKTGDMSGWINQGVLLINANLTHGATNWTNIVRFIIQYLSRTLENVVFIFAGKVAQEKVRFVNQDKHKVIRVVHPASYLYDKNGNRPQGKKHWDRVLPFTNANFYKLQKSPDTQLIDWHLLNGNLPKDGRMNHLRAFLLNILKDPRNSTLEEGARYSIAKYSAGLQNSQVIEDTEVFVQRHYKGHLILECERTSSVAQPQQPIN